MATPTIHFPTGWIPLTPGVPYSYQSTATPGPILEWRQLMIDPPDEHAQLPQGLTFNTTTGLISGTPTVAQTTITQFFAVKFAARNSEGWGIYWSIHFELGGSTLPPAPPPEEPCQLPYIAIYNDTNINLS